MAKNTGKVREFCQSGKVGTLIKQNISPKVLVKKSSKYFCWLGNILSFS